MDFMAVLEKGIVAFKGWTPFVGHADFQFPLVPLMNQL